MAHEHRHRSHPAVINRLRRAEGHLHKVIQMIEAGQTCLRIGQQLRAVEGAIANAKATLIEDHLDNCLDAVAAPLGPAARKEIEEFKKIARYL